MGTLIVHPDNKEKLNALKAFMKALKIRFEEQTTTYNPDFVKKIQQSEKEFNAGDYKTIQTNDLWK